MFKYRRKLSHLFAYNLPRLSKLYFQDIQFQRFNQKKKKKKKSKFTHYIMVLKHAIAKNMFVKHNKINSIRNCVH